MFDKIKAAVNGTDILAVIENLPVSANGFFLTADQMAALDSALGNENLAAELATAQTDLAAAQGTLATAQAELATAQTDLATAQTDLATAKETIASLESKEGAAVVIAASDNHSTETISKKYLTAYDV